MLLEVCPLSYSAIKICSYAGAFSASAGAAAAPTLYLLKAFQPS